VTTGYSDRINHALAFAAKHHDQMVRRGTRLPYATQSANIGIILTRYGRSDNCVVAGILHNVVADYVSDGFDRERLQQRIGDKFGTEVLEIALAVVERRNDSEGVELSQDERKADLLERLSLSGEDSRWVGSADKLHLCGTLLADLRRSEFHEAVWDRQKNGREATMLWHRSFHSRLQEIGFIAPIVDELGTVINALEAYP